MYKFMKDVCLEKGGSVRTTAVIRRCSVKKIFLKSSKNSEENTGIGVSFLIKSQAQACNLIKRNASTQVFPCEFC